MKVLLGLFAATIAGSASAVDTPCASFVEAAAENAHYLEYGQDDDGYTGYTVTDVDFLGTKSVSGLASGAYALYFVNGSDEVDGAGFLLSFHIGNGCRLNSASLLRY